jgi:hypothetical protein
MIGPVAFSVFTAVHAGIAFGALLLFDSLPVAAVCLFIVEAVTAFDNGLTVLGNRLGIGSQTELLNRMRFFLHAICISLLLPVYATIANAVAFSDTAAVLVYVLAWMLAAAIALFGYFIQYGRTVRIMPVNYFGCLRYAQSVSDITRHPDYEYSETELEARGGLPMASVATTLVGLILALLIGWFGSLWVPFIVTALMFLAGALPLRTWGPLATSCLEVIYSGGMLYSLAVVVGAPA